MQIIYKGHQLTLRESFLNYIAYEEMTGESFNPKGLKDIISYFYACVYAASYDMSDVVLNWKEFIEFLDKEPEKLEEFEKWLLAERTKQTDMISNEQPEEEEAEAEDKKNKKVDKKNNSSKKK